MNRALVVAWVASGWVWGCEDPSGSVNWDLQYGDECLRNDAVTLRVRVRHDGCFGTTVVFSQTLSKDAPELDTPTLDPGFYGLEAEALDAAMGPIGRGCIDVHLPLRGAGVITTIDPLPGRNECTLLSRPDAGPLPFEDAGPFQCMEARCDDMLDCTIDTCVSAEECLHTFQRGWCAIEGACFPNGAFKPGDPCLRCDTKSPATWWPSPAGISCGSGGMCDGIGNCR